MEEVVLGAVCEPPIAEMVVARDSAVGERVTSRQTQRIGEVVVHLTGHVVLARLDDILDEMLRGAIAKVAAVGQRVEIGASLIGGLPGSKPFLASSVRVIGRSVVPSVSRIPS